MDEAIKYLEKTEGNILVTTGSKELESYTRLTDYESRVYARVLSIGQVAVNCEELDSPDVISSVCRDRFLRK